MERGKRSSRPPALADILHDAAMSPRESLTVGELVARVGTRAHGFAILLLALPEALPLPIPSFGLFLAPPLLLVCFHLVLFGEGPFLPRRVASWSVPTRTIQTLDAKCNTILQRADRMATSRWESLTDRTVLIGLVCIYLTFLLVLPIPFFNIPPAVFLVVLAWGMVQRDGFAIAFGLAGTVGVTLFAIWSVDTLLSWWTSRG